MAGYGRHWLERIGLERIGGSNVLLGAAVALPLLLFGLASWQSYEAAVDLTTVRVERTARVLEEHALKVLETEKLVIDTVNERLGGRGDHSAADAPLELHRFLQRLQNALPQIGTITVTDAEGRLRASSRTYPVDPDLSFRDRDWFEALRKSAMPQPFISKAYRGRQSGLPIFNVSDRVAAGPGGQFEGVITISVDRSYFESFYQTVENSIDHSVVLVRSDGEILAAEPPTSVAHLGPHSTLLGYAEHSSTGAYRAKSILDGIDRYFAYRKIGNYPVYVRVGIAHEAALAPWRASLVGYGAAAAMASVCLTGAAWLARRQTKLWQDAAGKLQEEAARRALAEAELRQAQKMEAIGQLTGGLAHDFNNMLSVIIGAVNLAQRRWQRGETNIERYLDSAMEGATRAATLTQRLLAFARQHPLRAEPLAVNTLVTGLSELLGRTLGETIRLETRLDRNLWLTRADASALENTLLNLAVNARDAMPKGGTLTLATCNVHLDPAYAAKHDLGAGDFVLITVTDTGEGMSADVLAKAFEPFFTTKPIGKGSGLGLSQTYGFVKQSGGHIKIVSEPDNGSSFEIYLPRDKSGAVTTQEAAPAATKTTGPVGRPGEVVLVVEDDDRVRGISVAALKELGFSVLDACDGRTALDMIARHPDILLVFTDMVMPGMSGKELAQRARLLRRDLKLLFATGYSRDLLSNDEGGDLGASLILKPFTIDQLAERIRGILDKGASAEAKPRLETVADSR